MTEDSYGLSIASSFDYAIPLDQQIPMIAAAGFRHVSLGGRLDHSNLLSAGRRRIADLVQRHGLRVDTIHGPRLDQPEGLPLATAIAEAASDLGVGVVVVHASAFDFPPGHLASRLETVLQTCGSLIPVADRTGIRFALENVLPGPATNLVHQALQDLPADRFGFCYDSAHDQAGGPKPFDLPTELGDRLIALHLSDRVRDFIDHVLPSEGFIDWSSLCGMLRSLSFNGPLVLEAMTTHSAVKDPQEFLRLAYQHGCRLNQAIRGRG